MLWMYGARSEWCGAKVVPADRPSLAWKKSIQSRGRRQHHEMSSEGPKTGGDGRVQVLWQTNYGDVGMFQFSQRHKSLVFAVDRSRVCRRTRRRQSEERGLIISLESAAAGADDPTLWARCGEEPLAAPRLLCLRAPSAASPCSSTRRWPPAIGQRASIPPATASRRAHTTLCSTRPWKTLRLAQRQRAMVRLAAWWILSE